MSDNIENLLEFIEVSFDELAEADTPFFKQIRAVFRVCKAGKNILAGMRPDDAFEKFRDIMKHELKQLARSTHTDTHHLELLIKRLREIMNDKNTALSLYTDEKSLENELRKATDIPRDSALPKELAIIIVSNVAKIATAEEWCVEIYKKLEDLSLIKGSLERIEEFSQRVKWALDNSAQHDEKLEKLIKEKDSFFEYLQNTTLPRTFTNNNNKFHYLNANIILRGRDSEIKQLERFLYSRDIVSIWAISGQGGVGKSKLARHICERNSWCFKPVWLNKTEFDRIRSIRSWYAYEKPILFVCDYADELNPDIIDLIQKMHDHNIWSRFLLIVRQSNWYEGFKKNAVVKEHCYGISEAAPIDLSISRLGQENYRLIIEDFRLAYYSEKILTEKDIQLILDNTQKLSPTNSISMRDSRCLFMLLITDALLKGKLEECVDGKDLVDTYFDRSIKHKDSDYVEAGYRLFALATALGGLNISDRSLPKFITDDIDSINSKYPSKQERNSFLEKIADGIYTKDRTILQPIEPDIIGEYLFLWQYGECIHEEKQDEWLKYLSEKILSQDKGVTDFVSRCAADWKKAGHDFIEAVNKRISEEEQ